MCLIAALLAYPTAVATAQPRIVVARSAPDVRDRASSVADAVAEALRARGADVTRPSPAPVPPSETAALAVALDAYANLRPDDARGTLEALLARADATGARGLERPELLDALMTLSLACRALGDAPSADAALDRALAIEPALAPSLTQYPPTLVDAVEARRAAGAGAHPGVIELGPVPARARVFVDAQALTVPTSGRVEVAHGTHLVRVAALGRLEWATRIEVADAPVTVAPTLPPDADQLLREPGAPAERDAAELDVAARALGARAVVIDVSVLGSRVTLAIRDFARARTAATTVDATVRPEAVARGLAAAGGAVAIALTVIAIVIATSEPSDPTVWIGVGERR